jgi:hypothetical protein
MTKIVTKAKGEKLAGSTKSLTKKEYSQNRKNSTGWHGFCNAPRRLRKEQTGCQRQPKSIGFIQACLGAGEGRKKT